MQKFMDLINGKKTYIVVALAFVATIYLSVFHGTIPAWVWPILGAAGLGAVKAAMPSPDGIVVGGISSTLLTSKFGKYIPSILLAVGGTLQGLGIPVPEYVWIGLSGLGLGGLRANIEAVKKVV